jgi:hypothetical protein
MDSLCGGMARLMPYAVSKLGLKRRMRIRKDDMCADPASNVTDQKIQKWISRQHGFVLESAAARAVTNYAAIPFLALPVN